MIITQAVGISCTQVHARAEPGAGNQSIVINIPPQPAGVPSGVTLSGIGIDGRIDATTRTNAPGILIQQAAGPILLSDISVGNFTQAGVRDARSLSNGANLRIRGSRFFYNSGPGILLTVTTNGNPYGATISDTESSTNLYGIAVAANNRATVADSVFTNNFNANIEADGGGAILLSRTVSSNSAYGIQAYGSIRMSDSDIVENNVGILGTVQSFGNNRIQNASGNTPGASALEQ